MSLNRYNVKNTYLKRKKQTVKSCFFTWALIISTQTDAEMPPLAYRR